MTLEQKIEKVARLWSFGPMDARSEAEKLGLTPEQFQEAVALNCKRQDEANERYYTTGRAY